MASGIALWVLVGLVSRLASAARIFAIYVTVQAVLTLVLSALLTGYIVSRWGAAGGYGVLAAIDALLLLCAAPFVARRYPPAPGGARGMPPLPGLLVLASIACLLAGIMALWVYAIPLLRALGYAEPQIRAVMPAAIGCQIAGGLFSTALAGRIRPVVACVAGGAVLGAAIALLVGAPTPWGAILGLGFFAAAWMAIPAFQVPLLIEVDPSLRSALLIGTAQLGGLAAGPVIAANWVGPDGPQAAATVSVALVILSVAILPLSLMAMRNSVKTA